MKLVLEEHKIVAAVDAPLRGHDLKLRKRVHDELVSLMPLRGGQDLKLMLQSAHK